MKRNQIIAVAGCSLLLVLIYIFGNTKKPLDEGMTKGGGHAPAAQGGGQEQGGEALDIAAYISQVDVLLDTTTQRQIDKANATADYDALIGVYKKANKPLAVAYYAVKKALKTNTEKDYVDAGDYNYGLSLSAPDGQSLHFLTGNAVTCFRAAAQLDTGSTSIKIKLANSYLAEGSQPMMGVQLLLGIVRKDSNNVDALLALGNNGIKSGQLDKAIVRFEKVLYLQPQNSEALYQLGSIYAQKGDKVKAIELLEKCKATLPDTSARRGVEQFIESIKKP